MPIITGTTVTVDMKSVKDLSSKNIVSCRRYYKEKNVDNG